MSEEPLHDHGQGDCRQLFDALSPYLDGELVGASCEDLRRHMSECTPCQRYLDSLQATRDALHRMAKVEVISEADAEPLLRSCLAAFRAKIRGERSP